MRKLLLIIILVLIISLLPVPAFANVNVDNRITDKKVLDNLTDGYNITVLKEEQKLDYITNFDISNNGRIAVCYDNNIFNLLDRSGRDVICIYDMKGNFIYGYEFSCSGTAKVYFVDNRPAIYDVRGSLLSVIDQDGKISAVYDFIEPADNTPLVEEKEFNGKTYLAKSDGKYVDCYISIDEINGNEVTTIIAVDNKVNWELMFFIFTLVATGIIIAVHTTPKRKSKK